MSRFARLHSGPARIWAPPESPLRVEFSSALVREVRMSGTMVDAFGVLYGVRHGDSVRLVSTRGRAGLDPVGVFASRVRGEIFLTEEDLERFEQAEACVALVISGEKAGFFVRDAEGALETVRSYEEFSVHTGPSTPAPVVITARAARKIDWRWAWAIALLPLLYLVMPRSAEAPLAVSLKESSGVLKISWNVPKSNALMILDGGDLIAVPLKPEQTAISYGRRTGDVVVKLGSAQARFVGPPRPPNQIEQMRISIDLLRSRITELRNARAAGEQRLAALQRRLQ